MEGGVIFVALGQKFPQDKSLPPIFSKRHMRSRVCALATGVLLCACTGFGQAKFSGYMFGDYFYNAARDSTFKRGDLPNAAVGGQKDLQAFQFRRIYFTYDDDISELFATRFRLEADQSALSSNGKISTFVKDAYLKWKNIFSGSDFIFGIQPTPAYDISEAAWGYRSLEKTIMDLRGIVPSRGLGVSLKGRLGQSANYWVMISNNNSGNNPNGTNAAVDKFKRFYLHLQFKPVTNLQITAYADYLARPDRNDPKSTSVPPATLSNGTVTTAVFIGYAEKDHFSAGVEGFLSSRANQFVDGSGNLTSLTAFGFTAFGTYSVDPQWELILRYDLFDPNADGRGDIRNYILGGLSFKPDKNVMIIPNVQLETYEAIPGGPSFSASVTGRVTFYYIFL
jgi:Phosphate-selective porin O and P